MPQDSLFDTGGPVRPLAPRDRARQLRSFAPCKEPGCTKLRRRVQGARYCEEHARGTDNVLVRKNIAEATPHLFGM